jgi:hypothetical protein
MLIARDVRYLFCGRKWRTAESTGGGGTKVLRGREQAASGVEAAQVSTVSVEDAPYDSSLQDQVGRSHVPRLDDQCQHGGGARVRRVGHDPEGTSWWHEVHQIALDH